MCVYGCLKIVLQIARLQTGVDMVCKDRKGACFSFLLLTRRLALLSKGVFMLLIVAFCCINCYIFFLLVLESTDLRSISFLTFVTRQVDLEKFSEL